MFDTMKLRTAAGSASGFIASGASRSDIWAEAGRAIELANREQVPMSQAVRAAVVAALVVAAKLCSIWALR